jgi:hypothetical protein
MSYGTKSYPDFGERLISLSLLSIGLSHAIHGLTTAGNDAAVEELTRQLVLVAKRLTWIECTSDPNWSPKNQ